MTQLYEIIQKNSQYIFLNDNVSKKACIDNDKENNNKRENFSTKKTRFLN